MTYVDDYTAIRIILRQLPGGAAVASEGFLQHTRNSLVMAAVGTLAQAIYSDARVMVEDPPRPLAEHERGYLYDLWHRTLVGPYDRSLRNLLIDADALKLMALPVSEQRIDTGPLVAQIFAQSPNMAADKAHGIALDRGAIISRKDFRKLWESLAGPRKPGRKRAASAAE